MINNITIIGNLTKDAELKYTNAGTAVARLSLAYNHDKENVSYFDVTLWGEYAEKMNQYLVKGKQIAVQGELKQQRWEKDGQAQSRVGITARIIQLLGGTERKTAGPESFVDDSSIPF